MPSVSDFLVQVALQGPWLTFVTAFLETSFLTGLFVPAGAALSFATAFSLEQGGSLPALAAAALAGGAIGDSVGFWIGRKGRTRWSRGPGRLAQMVRSVRSRTARHFGGQPFLSVTIPRLISFARTVMPLAAGMSGISYARYLGHELIGVTLWCALYMTMGVAAGEGWHWAAQVFGLDGATVLLVVVVAAWFVVRRRFIHRRARRG